jgi:DNA-binding NtrC family response regulator
VIDDDDAIRTSLERFFSGKGFQVYQAESLATARKVFQEARPDTVILDYLLPDGNALDLMPFLRELDPEVPIVVLTAHGSIDLAVRAIKEGAENFLTKPVELEALWIVVERLMQSSRDRQKQQAGHIRRTRKRPDPFLGPSRAIAELRTRAERLVVADSPVLIQGETGSGKGVLARWMHDNGPRADEPFVDLNCSSLSRDLLESELFGHCRGAFTSATADKKGLLEIAHRGTIFLDEIADMEPVVQPKLLKVLEEMRFRRLGDVRDRVVDVRLIAASHQELELLVQQGEFRSDLYFRISTLPLPIPPLRERREDIPVLADHFLERFHQEHGGKSAEISATARQRMQEYRWPGNIRELRNVLERALLLRSGEIIEEKDLFLDKRLELAANNSQPSTLKELERRQIEQALAAENGHVARAAERLGVPRSTLYHKLKVYGISPSNS